MKSKNFKYYLISIIVLVFIAIVYFIFFHSSDKISKIVQIDSYQNVFDNKVKSLFNSSFSSLTDTQKDEILFKLIDDEDYRVGIVAARLSAELKNESKINNIFYKATSSEGINPLVVREILSTINKLNISACQNILIKIINRYNKNTDYYIPFSSSDVLSFVGYSNNSNQEIKAEECNNLIAPLDDRDVYEINLVFPSNPDYFLYLPNFDNNYNSFINSDFIEDFKKLEIYKELPNYRFFKKYYQIKNMIDDKFSVLSSLFEPDKLFKDNLSVAKYGEEYLICTFSSNNSKIVNTLVNAGSVVTKKYKISSYNFENYKIAEIIYSDYKFYFTEIEDYFILSTEKALLEKSITTFAKNKDKSLAADPLFNHYYKPLDHYGKSNYLFIYAPLYKILDIKGESNYSALLCKRALDILSKIQKRKLELKEQKIVDKEYSNFSQELDGDLMFVKLNGVNFVDYWNYVINIRSKSAGAYDSLLKLISYNSVDNLFKNFSNNLQFTYRGIYPNFNYSGLVTTMNLFEINVLNAKDVESSFITIFSKIFNQKPNTIKHQDFTIYSFLEADPNVVQYDPLPRVFCINNNRLYLASSQEMIINKINNFNSTQVDVNSKFTMDIKLKKVLINLYKYLLKLTNFSTKYSDYDVEVGIKPLLKHLSKINDIKVDFSQKENFLTGKIVFEIK